MEDNIILVDNEEIKKHIEMILRQTDYTEAKANEELKLHGYDPIKVIKAYLGITEKKAPVSDLNLNQEIYKQMRIKLDNVIRSYNVRKENNETKLK